MTSTSMPQEVKDEIRVLESHMDLAIIRGDFDMFKSAAIGIDGAHARFDDVAVGDVWETGRVSMKEARWNMTLPRDPKRFNAVFSIINREFQPGHADMARFLVGRGLDLDRVTNAVEGLGGSPLTYATEYGSPEILKVILDLGAAPSGPYKTGEYGDASWTPLRRLLMSLEMPKAHYEQKLEILLNAGATMETLRERIKGSELQTPLAIAASSGRWDNVLPLLQMGEDPFEKPASDLKNPCSAFELSIERLVPASRDPLNRSMNAWLAARRAGEAVDQVMQLAVLEPKGRVAAP